MWDFVSIVFLVFSLSSLSYGAELELVILEESAFSALVEAADTVSPAGICPRHPPAIASKFLPSNIFCICT